LGEQEASYNIPFLYGGTIHGFYSSNERCSLAQKVFGISWIQIGKTNFNLYQLSRKFNVAEKSCAPLMHKTH
jgi:hypothetical protein